MFSFFQTTTMENHKPGSILLEQSKAKKFLLELRKIVDGQDCQDFLNGKEDYKELDLNGIVPELVKTLRQNGEVCEWLIIQVKNGKKEGNIIILREFEELQTFSGGMGTKSSVSVFNGPVPARI